MNEMEKQVAECTLIISNVMTKHLGALAVTKAGGDRLVETGVDILIELIRAEKIEGVRFSE